MFRDWTRRYLLRLRKYDVPGGYMPDPHSLEYLYLIQQQKRLSLSTSIGRLRPGNIVFLPVILCTVLIKAADLWIANQVVRSLINERDLEQRLNAEKNGPG